jgi:hypothetical protein
MSILSIASELAVSDRYSYDVKDAFWYVIQNTKMPKMMDRISQAHYCPDIETKCVLIEYNHTSAEDVEKGAADISDRLPGTDLLMHGAFTSQDFRSIVNQYFLGNNPRASMYVRSKKNFDGTVHPIRKQVILVFDIFVADPVESDVSSGY